MQSNTTIYQKQKKYYQQGGVSRFVLTRGQKKNYHPVLRVIPDKNNTSKQQPLAPSSTTMELTMGKDVQYCIDYSLSGK